jgi:RNA polymerase sigma-70 factor (family 1)
MNKTTDIWLLAERVSLFNDEEAYKELFFHFYKGLHSFSASFVKSNEVAEEIVSDVFMNLWKNRSRLLEIENLKVYLFVAAKNLSLRYLNRSQKINEFSLDDLSVQTLCCTGQTPEELLISGEVVAKIQKAIDQLPPRCKIIFKMIREEGLKYKEVSQILNISVKTIDAQMAIASQRISQSIGFELRTKTA